MRDSVLDLDDVAADVEFDCPRCGLAVSDRFYGPCSSCSAELRSLIAGRADPHTTAAEYEPKMNVTPNAVALKDD